MRCAQNRVGVRLLPVERQILIRLGAAIDPRLAAGHMIIIVQLMHDGNERRQVDDRQAVFAGVFDTPLIEPHAPDGQRRHVSIGAATEDEKIDPRIALQLPFPPRTLLQFRFPAIGKVERLAHIQIGAPPHREKVWEGLPRFFDPCREHSGQNNVRVHVGKSVVRGPLFRLSKNVRQQRRTVPVSRDFRNVHQAQIGRTLRRTLFRAKEDDLRARLQLRPTGDGVALDDADVAAKRLGRSEESQHFIEMFSRRNKERKQRSALYYASGSRGAP